MVSSNVVYGMFDPRSGHLRYIGQTTNLRRRAGSHVSPSSIKSATPKNDWIRELQRLGIAPEFCVLECVYVPEDLNEAESWNVAYYRSLGCELLNGTADGLASTRGLSHTSEAPTRERGSQEKTGRRHSPETRAKIAASRLGTKRSRATKDKMSASHRARWAAIKSQRTQENP